MRNMNVRSGMSRRQFMGAVGAGAAGLVGAAMFGSSVSRAQVSVLEPFPSSTRDAVKARGVLKAAVPIGGVFEEELAACIATALGVGIEYNRYKVLNYDLVGMGQCDVAFGKKPWSLLDDSLRNIRIGPIYYLDSQNEGYAVAVRNGDDVWHDIVAWTMYLLITFEYTNSVGNLPTYAFFAGLDQNWAINVIEGHGDYGSIFNATKGGEARGSNLYPELGGKLIVPII